MKIKRDRFFGASWNVKQLPEKYDIAKKVDSHCRKKIKKFQRTAVLKPCGHRFHRACVLMWFEVFFFSFTVFLSTFNQQNF